MVVLIINIFFVSIISLFFGLCGLEWIRLGFMRGDEREEIIIIFDLPAVGNYDKLKVAISEPLIKNMITKHKNGLERESMSMCPLSCESYVHVM